MYPFAIINFAGGSTPPGEKGLKRVVMSPGGGYFALGNNGDLYTMGGIYGNGLGRTGTENNKPSGWTLTNSGVDDIYGGMSQGCLIKKGTNFYTTGQYNGFPGSDPDATQNDWRLVDPAWYNLNGYSILDNLVTFYPGMVLCSNGKVYTYTTDAFTEFVPNFSTGFPAGSLFKWLHVSADSENKILITTTGGMYAKGYNGMGKAISSKESTAEYWTDKAWKQVRDAAPGAGYEEAYILQSRRRNSGNTTMERYNLIVARKEDGTWWVSGTLNTGLGNANQGTTDAANVMKASTIPALSKVIVGEAAGYNWASFDRNWYMTHQVFVENDALGIHQSTGDQGTVYTLANGTTATLNCTALTNLTQPLLDAGGVQHIFPHIENDRVRFNLIVAKNGKLFFTGHGSSTPELFPPGWPTTPANDTGPGYNLSGPYDMPNFG